MLRKEIIWGGLWGDRVEGVSCPAKAIVLARADNEAVGRYIAARHYSGTACQNTAISFFVYWYGEVHGALQLGYGIRPDVNGGREGNETREFDRMWLSDDMPKYSETIVLSLLHLFMRKAFPDIRRIVSYADTSVGNTGTIYRAANYREVGRIPVDFYLLPGGDRVHPVTMWHRHGTRAWEYLKERYPGIQRVKGGGLVHIKYEFTL